MGSRRCSICGGNWPNTDAFKTCPRCGDSDTWYNQNDDPDDGVNHPPRVPQAMPPYMIDAEVKRFRRWLDTVEADDFKDRV